MFLLGLCGPYDQQDWREAIDRTLLLLYYLVQLTLKLGLPSPSKLASNSINYRSNF